MGNLSSMMGDHTLGDQIGSGGPNNLWKIFNAKRKSNGESVSLFVFDKTVLEKYPKQQREDILKMLRHEIRHLTKLRHPRILSILKAEPETKKAIVIETEPIFASLSNVLRDYTNISPTHQLKGFELEPLEVKIGMMHIAEAVNFLHNTANLIHRNITPGSIYITKKGEWKLSGFNFAAHTNYKPGGNQSTSVKEYNSKIKGINTEPDLDYIAPEYIFTKQYGYASDLFSLGCVLFQVYAQKKLITNSNNVLNYKQNIENLHQCLSSTRNIPPELHEPLAELLRINPRDRADTHRFMSSSYFQDTNIQALTFLASLLQTDNGKKAAFFKGFSNIIGNFTPRIVEMKVLPPLLQELKNTVQIPFLLPIIITISEAATPRKFETMIYPHLFPLFQMQEASNILSLLIPHLELFISKLSAPTVEKQLLPFLYQILDGTSIRNQDLVIRKIPDIASKIDYSTLISKFTPRIITIITSQAGLRLNGLVCINKLIPLLDRGHIMEQILPVLESLRAIDDPKIMTAIFHCFSSMTDKMGPQISATRMIPVLAPMSIHPCLEQEQFDLLVKTMKTMIKSIENWRKEEFKAKAEVAKHMEDSSEAEFIQHQNFQNLVSSEYSEKQTGNTIQTKKIIESAPPPTADSLSSFEELIQSEEASRQKNLQSRSKQEIFSDIGGTGVQNIQNDLSAFKSIQIGDNNSKSNDDEFNFDSFTIDRAPSAPKRERYISEPKSDVLTNPSNVYNSPTIDLFQQPSIPEPNRQTIPPTTSYQNTKNTQSTFDAFTSTSNTSYNQPQERMEPQISPYNSFETSYSNNTSFNSTSNVTNQPSDNFFGNSFSQQPGNQTFQPQPLSSDFSFGTVDTPTSNVSNPSSNFDFGSFTNETNGNSEWNTTSFSASNFFS